MKKVFLIFSVLFLSLTLSCTNTENDSETTNSSPKQTLYTIIFDANGGTGTMQNQTFYGDNCYLNANSFSREGYKFLKWNTEKNSTGIDIENQGKFSPSKATTTLFAQWEKIETITVIDINDYAIPKILSISINTMPNGQQNGSIDVIKNGEEQPYIQLYKKYNNLTEEDFIITLTYNDNSENAFRYEYITFKAEYSYNNGFQPFFPELISNENSSYTFRSGIPQHCNYIRLKIQAYYLPAHFHEYNIIVYIKTEENISNE